MYIMYVIVKCESVLFDTHLRFLFIFVRSKYYKLLFFQTIQVKEVFMHSLGQRLANP